MTAWWRLHQVWYFARAVLFAAPALWEVAYVAADEHADSIEVIVNCNCHAMHSIRRWPVGGPPDDPAVTFRRSTAPRPQDLDLDLDRRRRGGRSAEEATPPDLDTAWAEMQRRHPDGATGAP